MVRIRTNGQVRGGLFCLMVQTGGLTPACVPIDLFGDGTVSQAALNYIAPGRTER